jgi:hypothetical protein
MRTKGLRNFLCAMGVLFVNYQAVFSQSTETSVPMADTFRAEGKIYVVVGSFLLIMAGLLTFILLTERRVKRLENELKDKNKK